MIIDGNNGIILAGPAEVLDTTREMAWAQRSVRTNPAYSYIIGRYVEADRANSNGQLWTLPDLQKAYTTVIGSPMNMIHKSRYIVGHFADAELLYPVAGEGDAAAAQSQPFIDALGLFYKYFFPDEFAAVEAAHKEGALFYSMECVGDSITCSGEGGCQQEFAYVGRQHQSYCAHLNEGGVRQINNPHFLAGALIIPPVQPGWTNAEIHSLVAKYAVEAESAYQEVKALAPHLDAKNWEAIMVELMQLAHPL